MLDGRHPHSASRPRRWSGICLAQWLLWLVIALLGTASVLSACGQKGDLYRPDSAQSFASGTP